MRSARKAAASKSTPERGARPTNKGNSKVMSPRSTKSTPSVPSEEVRTPNTCASKKSCSAVQSEHGGSSLLADDGRSTLKSRGKNKMEHYPLLTKFYHTAEELHEEYGLSLQGVLPKDLNEVMLPKDQWLTVFKFKHNKGAKIYVNHVHHCFIDDCRLLFHKVYQAPPSCGEITTKFARGYAFERCHAATKDPAGHIVAWAKFGENVIQMCSARAGGLEQKIEAWRKANVASKGALDSGKKPRITQSGSNLCTETGPGDAYRPNLPVCDYVADLELLVERIPGKSSHTMDRLFEMRTSIELKKEALLRCEGSNSVAKQIKADIELYTARLQELRNQIPINDGEAKEVEADLVANQRMLQRLGVTANIKKL